MFSWHRTGTPDRHASLSCRAVAVLPRNRIRTWDRTGQVSFTVSCPMSDIFGTGTGRRPCPIGRSRCFRELGYGHGTGQGRFRSMSRVRCPIFSGQAPGGPSCSSWCATGLSDFISDRQAEPPISPRRGRKSDVPRCPGIGQESDSDETAGLCACILWPIYRGALYSVV